MTLDVENCHATVHAKKVNMSKLEYARSFGATMKESVKRAYGAAVRQKTVRRETTMAKHGSFPEFISASSQLARK